MVDVRESISAEGPLGHRGHDVFVSYSRVDRDTVVSLTEGLAARGKRAWVDLEDIPPSAEWLTEVRRAIDAADGYLVLVSPDLAASKACSVELEHARQGGKRIVPVQVRQTDPHLVPDTLAALNWIDATDGRLDEALDRVVSALDTDLEHVRAHSRLLVRAREWESKGSDRSLLLRGSDLAEAETFLVQAQGKEPAPTTDQASFIGASRQATSRRQRAAIGAIAVALVVSLALAGFAIVQRSSAVEAQARAEERALESRSRELAASANSQVDIEPQRALLLAREAIAISSTPEAEEALRETILASNIRAIVDAGSQVGEVAFDPSGERIVSAQDGEVVVWDLETREPIVRLPVAGPVQSASFDPRGTRIASGGDDGVVRVWDVVEEDERLSLEGHGDFVRTVRWSPDGTRIVSASPDSIRVWNAGSGRLIHELRPRFFFWSAELSPDGTRVVASDRSGVASVFDMATGDTVDTIATGPAPLTHALYSPDGSTIATAGDDGVVRLYSADGLELRMALPHADGIERVSFSQDGAYLMTADSGGTGHVWDPSGGFELGRFLTDTGVMTSISLSGDGRTVMTSGQDGTIRLWSPSPALPLARFETGVPNHGGSLDVSGDRGAFFGAFGAPTSIWDVASGDVVLSLELDQPATSTAFSPDGNVLAVGVENGVLAFDADSGRRLFSFEGEVRSPSAQDNGYTPDVAYAPDGGSVAAVALLDPSIHLWDSATGELRASWEAGQEQLSSVAISPQGNVATAGAVGVKVWSSPDELAWESATGAPVVDVSFDGSGALLAGAVRDGTAVIWNAKTGDEVGVFTGHENEVVAVSLSPDGRYLISSAFDGTARIWDVASGEELQLIEPRNGSWVTSVTFAPDRRTVLVTSIGGRGGTYPCDVCTNIDGLLQLAEERSVRSLTPEERATYLGQDT